MPYSGKRLSRLARISVLSALALAVWIVEEFLPRPAPWMKPGLSYVVVIVAMRDLGVSTGVAVALARTAVGSVMLGKIASPAFLLSLAGTLCACAAMALMMPALGRAFSAVGVSVAGAFSHQLAQISVAAALMGRGEFFAWFVPASALWSIVAGAVVGVLAQAVPKLKA